MRNYNNLSLILLDTSRNNTEKILGYLKEFVNEKYFEVEKVLNYLMENEIIGKEIFTNYVRDDIKSKFGLTYLSKYIPVRREKFIKRIPIYYYDVLPEEKTAKKKNESLTEKEDKPSMTNFLHGFFRYKMNEEPVPDFTKDEYIYPNSEDDIFESVYEKLEDLMYDYGIELEKIFEYLVKQAGSESVYSIFEYWTNYLRLIDYKINKEAKELFPRNILYSYNKELIKLGRSPEIFMPYNKVDYYSGKEEVYYELNETENSIELYGYFPVDENNEPVYEWIGIYTENCELIKPEKEEIVDVSFLPTSILNQMTAALKKTIKYKIGPESRIFAATKDTIGKDEFNNTYRTREYWKEIYVGTALMTIDINYIERLRLNKNITIKQLSENTGIDVRSYQRISSEEVTPNGLNLLKIMRYLGIYSYDEIIKKQEIDDPKFKKFLLNKKIYE